MSTDAHPGLVRGLRTTARVAAAVVVGVALLVLVGWWLEVEALKSLMYGERIAMNPLTAVGFILAGVSLWMLQAEPLPAWRRGVGVGLGVGVAAVALVTLARFVVGVDVELDRLLFRTRLGTNRMAPNTAVTFLAAGLALAATELRVGRHFWPWQLFVLTALGSTLLSLTGYLYGVQSLFEVSGYIPMALNTALTFAVLCTGILCSRPRREPTATIARSTVGGAMARRLLPAAFLIPLLLGWIRLHGERRGLYDTEFGISLYALGTIILFNGIIWWYAGVIHRTDVRRRAAEVALRENEGRIRRIVDSAHDAFIVIDEAGVVTDWNKQAEATFGWTREEAIGRVLADTIIPPQYREAHARGIEHFLHTGEGPVLNHRIELSALYRDGREFPVELTIAPIRLEDRWIFSAFVHDITERKEAERELREKNRLLEQATRTKSEFLANMSHEIRTPMNGIIGMAELLSNTDLTAQQQEYLHLVRQSADSLLRLLNDILDFSKIEAGRLELESIPFALRDALGDTLQTLAIRASEKGLELAYRIPPDVPDRLIGDPGRLRQIVVNLAGNAIKFTEQGEVVVTVERAEEKVEAGKIALHVSVRDTGIGIAPEKQQLIFEAFSQADSSMSRRFGGTGLGLAISMELVSLMGGRMWVESEAGQGSTFHFTAVYGLQKGRRKDRDRPRTLRGLPVLVVDDNATNRRILAEILASWGMVPELADCGPAALEALERAAASDHPFHLVLLDGMMPGMDGYTLAERIRRLPAGAEIPLMMLSSAGRGGSSARAEELHIGRTLTKPVKQSDLLDAVVEVLEGPDGEPVPGEAEAVDTGAHVPRRILLAEDGVVNQKVALSLLERHGHTVVVAGNGREAVEALEREPFELVLMDIQMPEMDGLEATAAIREREKATGGHIPIVAMTAHAMKGDRERCLEAGMDDYLSKPIRADELYAMVDRLAAPADGAAPTVPVSPEVTPTGDSNTMEAELKWDEARERIGGSEATLRDLAQVFAEECPPMMDDIRGALSRGDAAALRRAAHTLKGSAAIFVAEPTVDAAYRLEQIGEAGELEDAPAALAELELRVKGLLAALRERTGGGEG